MTLRTTFIVGFPGEREEDVEELCDFVGDMEFDHLGVFTYSHEEGTGAGRLDDDVPARVKRSRQRRLMTLQRRLVTRRTATGRASDSGSWWTARPRNTPWSWSAGTRARPRRSTRSST